MKHKVKFRITARDGKKHKFAMNLEAGTDFRLGDELKQLGLEESQASKTECFLSIKEGALWIDDQTRAGGLQINNKVTNDSMVKQGDFLQLGGYVYEILEAPQPSATESGTRFVDVDEIPKNTNSLKIERPKVEAPKSEAVQEAVENKIASTFKEIDPFSHSDPFLQGRPFNQKKSATPVELKIKEAKPSTHQPHKKTQPVKTQVKKVEPDTDVSSDTLLFLEQREKRVKQIAITVGAAASILLVIFLALRKGSDSQTAESSTPETVVDLQAYQANQAANQAPAAVAPVVPSPTSLPSVVQDSGPTVSPVSGAQNSNQGFNAAPKVQDPFAVEQFFGAIRTGNLRVVRSLIESGAVDPSFTLEKGSTPLMFAAAAGHKSIVRFLLSRRVTINAKDPSGTTALMWAVYRGHHEVVKILLDAGADPHVKRDDGDTALDIAKRWGKYEIASLLDRYTENKRSLASPQRNQKKYQKELPKKVKQTNRN